MRSLYTNTICYHRPPPLKLPKRQSKLKRHANNNTNINGEDQKSGKFIEQKIGFSANEFSSLVKLRSSFFLFFFALLYAKTCFRSSENLFQRFFFSFLFALLFSISFSNSVIFSISMAKIYFVYVYVCTLYINSCVYCQFTVHTQNRRNQSEYKQKNSLNRIFHSVSIPCTLHTHTLSLPSSLPVLLTLISNQIQ